MGFVSGVKYLDRLIIMRYYNNNNHKTWRQYMSWGLKNRLARIIKPADGRTVMLAVDHGYFLGPTSRLEDPRKTIEPILNDADTLMLTRGVLRNCVDADTATPIVLRVSRSEERRGGEECRSRWAPDH